MNNVYGNIDDYNPNRKRKILIAFHDMIADIMANKKFQAIINELRCKKLNILLVFIMLYLLCLLMNLIFFSNHTTLPATDPLRFRKNLFQSYKNASSS